MYTKRLNSLKLRNISQKEFMFQLGDKVENQYSYFIEENLLGDNDGEVACFSTLKEAKEFFNTTIKLSVEEKDEMNKLERITSEINQKEISKMVITIEWRKSQMWGSNPLASAKINFSDGSFYRTGENYTAGGCGYDKESTVIALIFNEFMKGKLWNMKDKILKDRGEKLPYGISAYEEEFRFDGGIGTSCYIAICEYIGYTFKTLASGSNFDVFEVTKNEE